MSRLVNAHVSATSRGVGVPLRREGIYGVRKQIQQGMKGRQSGYMMKPCAAAAGETVEVREKRERENEKERDVDVDVKTILRLTSQDEKRCGILAGCITYMYLCQYLLIPVVRFKYNTMYHVFQYDMGPRIRKCMGVLVVRDGKGCFAF